MIPANRITLASIMVGIIGAILGGSFGIAFMPSFGSEPPHWLAIPIGIITGFLACFSLSNMYLKKMEHRRWQAGIFWGLLFAVEAGAISGALTGFSYDIGSSIGNIIFCGVYGAIIIGTPSAVVAWLVLTIIYIVFVKKPLPNNKKI